MLRWAFIFLIIALGCAILGFGGLSGTISAIGRPLFFLFLALFAVGVVRHVRDRRSAA